MPDTFAESVARDVFHLDYGTIVVQWPKRLSPDDGRDMEELFKLILRKSQRWIKQQEPETDA